MGGEVKPAKGLRRHLNVGFVAGFLIILLTYVIVSQQFAVETPAAITSSAPRMDGEELMTKSRIERDKTEQEWQQQPKEMLKDTSDAVSTQEFPKSDSTSANPIEEEGNVVCRSNGFYSDTCDVSGDVRINATALSVTLLTPSRRRPSDRRQHWNIQPYPRRTVSGIRDVTVTHLSSPSPSSPACTVTHGDVPGVVFALGGLTGNYWHDFSDILIPLFAATWRHRGEVILLVTNTQPWWLAKYGHVIRRLSRHDAVHLDADMKNSSTIHCFRHVTVGLRMSKEFAVSPDFAAFLRETYSLPRSTPAIAAGDRRRPRLAVLRRAHYRKILNTDELILAAEAAGFEAAVMDPQFDTQLSKIAMESNSFDAMVGVHGAGLTNAVFLPAGGVVIQIVPYGRLERMANADFGEPLAEMGLRYIEYSVTAGESTLLEMLGPEHPVVKDPEGVHRSGWDKVAEYYLGKQDVRINVTRFKPVLEQAMDHLRQKVRSCKEEEGLRDRKERGEMGGDHGKLMKSLKGAAQKYLGVGFLLGFFLVLLTYFTVSEQFAIAAPNAIRKTSPGHSPPTITPAVEEKRHLPPITEQHQAPKTEHEHAAVVQEKPASAEEIEIQTEAEEDHSQQPTADVVTTVEKSAPAKKPACDIQGPWASDVCTISGEVRIHGSAHAVFIPPAIESGASNPNSQSWQILPYSRKHMGGIKDVTVRELTSPSDAPPCDVTSSPSSAPAALVFAMGGLTGNYWHDFSDVIIPLYLQARRFDGEVQLVVTNIQRWYVGKYRQILRRLSRYDVIDMDADDKVRCFPGGAVVGIRMHKEFSIDPSKDPTGHSMPEFTKFLRETFSLPRSSPVNLKSTKVKPRMMIISRRHPRKLVNVDAVVNLAERIGFEVDFGTPARDMGLKYIAYSAGVEESTLPETLGRDHPAVRDPEGVHRSGWGKVAEYYLGKQDVRLDLVRFEPVLRQAMDYLKEGRRLAMAFMAQHGAGRAIATKASARERKPRHINGKVKNLSKPERSKQQLAIRLFPACLLALFICVCVAKFIASLSSSQALLIGAGSRVVSSWEDGASSTNVPRIPVAPLIMATVDEDISTGSPELGSDLKSGTYKNGTDSDNKPRSVKQAPISTENDPPPGKEESLTKSPETGHTKDNNFLVKSAWPNSSLNFSPAVPETEPPKPKSKISCDDKSKDEGFPYARPIVCHMSGDIRISPLTSSVTLTMPLQQTEETSRRIRPYARKDEFLVPLVREVTVTSAATESEAPKCNLTTTTSSSSSHGGVSVTAVIFSIGGYTGNFFHDMADVLLPLYLTTFHLKGKVQFFITDYKQWWIQKYRPILRRLSHLEIINFDTDRNVHCFDHAIIGLVRDRDLILSHHPTRNPNNYTMVDFTRFLRHAYGLKRNSPILLGEKSGEKPRMMIVSRRRTRRILNVRRVAAVARELGFDVVVSEAGGNVRRFASAVNACDVLVGVHGAGLANSAFLPPASGGGGVVVQVVPWGRMEWMAENFYGKPAEGMGLRHVAYHVAEEESSLAARYPRGHLVFRDPMAIHAQGWKALADVIMTQDVRIDLKRFRRTLLREINVSESETRPTLMRAIHIHHTTITA
uniref:Glycosyltransferase 61 catalytic domain-containing protein n=1 Tax=Leersia perrieri TaxID=77586 RepID=A0A0D9UW51_9ORYZ